MQDLQTRNDTFVAHVGEGAAGQTARRDGWWIEPTLVTIGLVVFIIYSTWAALVGTNYQSGPYISPFYSPLIRIPGLAWISPAIFVLWVPLGFRGSCYYYRKAYYRAFFWSPPACAVSERPKEYRGESGGWMYWLPVLHRWFLYLSIIVLAILWYDAFRAFDFDGHFGLGLGTIVLLVNAAMLTAFTFGCHALRSIVGGNQKCFACGTGGDLRYRGWKIVSYLTGQHPMWAWLSLYMVAIADLYVRLLAAGVLQDPRIF